MDPDNFLRMALEELRIAAETDPPNEYLLIRGSGLLRLMFADSRALLDQVPWARTATFEVHAPESEIRVQRNQDITAGLGGGMLLGRWVAARPDHPSKQLSRQDFLTHVTATSSWTDDLAVKTAIRVGATAFGGVHMDTPRDPEEANVAEVLRWIDEGSEDRITTLCNILREICATVVNSLVPLIPS